MSNLKYARAFCLVMLILGAIDVWETVAKSEEWTPLVIIDKTSMKYDPNEGLLSFTMGIRWQNETGWTFDRDDYEHPYKFGESGLAVNNITVTVTSYDGPEWADVDRANASQTSITIPAIDDDTRISLHVMKHANSIETVIPRTYRISTHYADTNTTPSNYWSQDTIWDRLPSVAPGQHLERTAELVYEGGYSNAVFNTTIVNNDSW